MMMVIDYVIALFMYVLFNESDIVLYTKLRIYFELTKGRNKHRKYLQSNMKKTLKAQYSDELVNIVLPSVT